tara:strand:+ start:1472 stop:1633 length:162 start_codon:yes stop_codon:yes gene_type:complete
MNADCDIKMTEKEAANLTAWKRWGLMMKLLKSIHREVEPKKQELRHAFNTAVA